MELFAVFQGSVAGGVFDISHIATLFGSFLCHYCTRLEKERYRHCKAVRIAQIILTFL